MPYFSRPPMESLIALITLTGMEIILGVDNIIFIALIVAKLPAHQQARTRSLGLMLALVTRLGLLFTMTWLIGMTRPLFHVLGQGFSGRDLILLAGGAFLVAKATFEIHHKIED